MRKINLDTLSEETARQVIFTLDLLSASEENTLVFKGKEAIYWLSRVQQFSAEATELASKIEKQISKESTDDAMEALFELQSPDNSFADTLDELLDGPPMLKDKYMKGDPDQLRRDAWGGRGVR